MALKRTERRQPPQSQSRRGCGELLRTPPPSPSPPPPPPLLPKHPPPEPRSRGSRRLQLVRRVAAATAAFAGNAACVEGLIVAARACAAEELERQRQHTTAGASGSGGKASTGITAVPATETAPPPSTTSPAQTAVTREGRTGTASAASISQEAAAAAPTHASDRAALVSRLYTFAESTAMVMYADMKAWVESEYSGDWAAVAAAAEGGSAKAQYVMSLAAPHISVEERIGLMARATEQPGVNLAHTLAKIASSIEEPVEPALRYLEKPSVFFCGPLFFNSFLSKGGEKLFIRRGARAVGGRSYVVSLALFPPRHVLLARGRTERGLAAAWLRGTTHGHANQDDAVGPKIRRRGEEPLLRRRRPQPHVTTVPFQSSSSSTVVGATLRRRRRRRW
jgi:hypothetical protein